MICPPIKDNCGEDSPPKPPSVLDQQMVLLIALVGGKVSVSDITM